MLNGSQFIHYFNQNKRHLMLFVLPAVKLIKTYLMCSNLLLQLGCRAPDDITGDQSLSFFCPAQNECFHAPIFLHLPFCLLNS